MTALCITFVEVGSLSHQWCEFFVTGVRLVEKLDPPQIPGGESAGRREFVLEITS
jgi:hypothetical protein